MTFYIEKQNPKMFLKFVFWRFLPKRTKPTARTHKQTFNNCFPTYRHADKRSSNKQTSQDGQHRSTPPQGDEHMALPELQRPRAQGRREQAAGEPRETRRQRDELTRHRGRLQVAHPGQDPGLHRLPHGARRPLQELPFRRAV